MTDKNSWNYKIGFEFYATEVDDETYDFTNLLECVEYKLNNTLSGEPIEDCFPMTIGAGNTEHKNAGHIIDYVVDEITEQYLEECGHPAEGNTFWHDLKDRATRGNESAYTSNQCAILDCLNVLCVLLQKEPCQRLDTEEIEVTLKEIKQHAPELLVSNE